MHEFSLAEALLQQVEANAPRHSVVRHVRVEIGPLQMVDGEALNTAWNFQTAGTRADGAELVIDWLPCERTCPACGRRWSGGDLVEICSCGHPQPRWIDGAKLILASIEVERAGDTSPPASQPYPERPES
ncbi:MAG: hydrogenase maturation nickel metallochaperone HypA [Planctomycetota bacterium]